MRRLSISIFLSANILIVNVNITYLGQSSASIISTSET